MSSSTINIIAAIGIIIFVIIIVMYYDPEIDYASGWPSIDGLWRMDCDKTALMDKYNTLPPKNGIIFKVLSLEPSKVVGTTYEVGIAFCDIKNGRAVNIEEPIRTYLSVSNTGFDIVSFDDASAVMQAKKYTIEILRMTRRTMYGFVSGPTFDTIINFTRV